MPQINGTWTKIDTISLPRSSHSVSVVGDTAYIFGGEIQPRQPVSNSIHAISLKTGQHEEIKVDEKDGSYAPSARVGHTAAVHKNEIWVFGGRDGPNPAPLEETGALHVFSPSSRTWRKVSGNNSTYPAGRSYHCSTATSTGIILHSGCGDNSVGRLNDVWEFRVDGTGNGGEWIKIGDAPGENRGGSAISFASSSEGLGSLWRFGGFNGKTEVGGVIDQLELGDETKNKWECHEFDASINDSEEKVKQDAFEKKSGPPARSVTALHALPSGRIITLFGEGKPSNLGHEGAGNFWGDVWTFDPVQKDWTEVLQKIGIDDEVKTPEARGWFGSDVWRTDDGTDNVVVWGGLAGSNDRLGDGWVLKLA